MAKFRSLFTSLALLALCGSSAWAQRRVTGVVTAEGSNEPLSAASVQVSGTTVGVYTGEDGRFTITVPEGAQTLRVRRIGYQQRQAALAPGQTELTVSLTRDVLQLEGVTVTGQATAIDRRSAATAVDQVQAEELTRAPSQSLDNSLQGKITGATIRQNSGAPGGGAQIQIRGPTSILGSAEPLIVIDGVLSSNATIGGGSNALTRASGGAAGSTTGISASQDNPVNRLADINPNEIESIEVLKSAAAAAIYGSKATNGVIVITTKRGAGTTPRFNLTQRVGTYSLLKDVGSRRFPSNPADLTESQRTSLSEAYSAAELAPILESGTIPFYDYQGDLYGRTGLAYETTGGISGGVGTARYRVSGTTKSDPGIVVNSGANRQSLRLNVDNAFGSRWTTSVGGAILRSKYDRGVQGNANAGATSPIYLLGYQPAIFPLNSRDSVGNYFVNPQGNNPANVSNPFQTFAFLTNREDVYRLQGSSRADYQALTTDNNTVRLTGVLGVDRYDQGNDIFSPGFLQYEAADNLRGLAVRSNSNNLQYNAGVNAVWTFTPSNNLFSATTSIGTQYEVLDQRITRVRQDGLVPTVPTVATGQVTTVNDQRIGNRTVAFNLSEDLLAFSDRLTISGGVRAERNSLNGDPDQIYYFPRGALAYRFIEPFTGVNEFKLRGSVGQTGNQTRYGDRDVTFNPLGVIGGGNALGTATTVGNPDIQPERMTEVEGGFDAAFANNRIGAEFTYYDRTIRDLLLNFPLPASTGLGNFVSNGGRLAINGYEAALRIAPVQTRDFTWTSRSTYYAYKAVTEDLPSNVPAFNVPNSGFGAEYGRNRQAEGVSTTAIWGNRPVNLVVRDTRDTTRFVALKNAAGGDSTVRAVRDTVLGDARPRFQMTFANDFTYRGLGLNVLLDWRYKGLLSNMTKNLFDEGLNSRDFDEPSPCIGSTRTNVVGDFCEGADTASSALMGEYRYAKWNSGQDARAYLEEGSFLKVREIALTYALPQSVTARALGGARDVRLSLAGRNLFMISNYWSFDPEVSNFGNQNTTQFVDLAPFPPSRSFFFSVDVGF